jgi:hypothetical protein
MLDLAAIETEAAGGVALRIQVDHQDRVSGEGKVRRKIYNGGGLADATLLVGAGDDLAHSGPQFGHRHGQILAFGAGPRIVRVAPRRSVVPPAFPNQLLVSDRQRVPGGDCRGLICGLREMSGVLGDENTR